MTNPASLILSTQSDGASWENVFFLLAKHLSWIVIVVAPLLPLELELVVELLIVTIHLTYPAALINDI